MTHGSLLERYGVHTLIQAVPLLIPSIPEIDVTIVGDGEYRPQLQELCRQLGLDSCVHFIGFVPIQTIPDIITKTEIGIVPILMHMQPTKLFEYIAMGKPVVASDFAAMRGCFGSDSVCYYKPGDVQGLADCILDLYRNPEKRSALSRSAFSVYQQYRWDVMKNVYTGVFDRMVTKGEAANTQRTRQ
jgi:glycosyltransferase involved in cell wall biosynthesis